MAKGMTMEIEITNENVKACAIAAGWHGAGSEADAWAYLRRVGMVARSRGPKDFRGMGNDGRRNGETESGNEGKSRE